MPNLKEILGDSYAQIPEDLKKKYKDIDLVDSSSYVERKELDTANNSIKEYKKQLKERDTQLNDLQGKAKDNEALTKEIEELKKKNEDSTKTYEDKLSKLNFDAKFEKAVSAFNPKNPKALKALLDMEKVKLVDDTFIGLDEQIKTLKESDAYLFEQQNLGGGTGNLGNSSSSLGNIDNSKKESLGERLAKERAEQLKGNEKLDGFFK